MLIKCLLILYTLTVNPQPSKLIEFQIFQILKIQIFVFLYFFNSASSSNSALSSLFTDQETTCDHDHDDEPNFQDSSEINHVTIGFHGAAVQLSCSVIQLNHRAVSYYFKKHMHKKNPFHIQRQCDSI